MEDALFESTEAALLFAFRYAHQQSPRTPMTHLLQCGGSGKGLHGIDGAAQAGMILAALDRLPRDERYTLTVRYGDIRTSCPRCGQPKPTDEWQDACVGLMGFVELEGLPRSVRCAMIEQVLCRRRADMAAMCKRYRLIERTAYRQLGLLKERLRKLERRGMEGLTDEFGKNGLIKTA